MVVAAVLLSAAVWLNNGLYDRVAIAVLLGAMVCFVHGLLLRQEVPEGVLSGFYAAAIAAQGAMLLACPPLNDVSFTSRWSAWPHDLLWTAAVLMGVSIGFVRRYRLVFVAMAVCVVLAGLWTIGRNPTPRVDVFYFQRDAAEALLRGINPYGLSFPNPYTEAESWVYAPGVAGPDGRLDFGFPYLPVTLLAVAPAQWVLGDFRYAHLLWLVVPAVAVVMVLGTRAAAMAMALLLTFPRLPWVIEWGWTEPVLVGALLLSAALTRTRSGGTASTVAVAVLLAGKQYMALVAPLMVVVWPGRRGRRIGLTLLIGCALTLPLVLWDFAAFWSSAVSLQFRQPFRPDALSVPALLYDLWQIRLPEWLSLLAAGVLAVVLANRRRVSLELGLALVLPVLFLLSKQAFANYYFLVFGCWCAVLATATADAEQGPLDLETPAGVGSK
jgi:hypothetical protein